MTPWRVFTPSDSLKNLNMRANESGLVTFKAVELSYGPSTNIRDPDLFVIIRNA